MCDVVEEREFPEHAEALRWAVENDELEDDIFRVEFLGPQGDWRWAGAFG